MNLRTVFMWSIVAVVFVSMAVFVAGCKDDETSGPSVTPVPDNIFPLVAGHYFEYNGWLTQNDTETKIAASEATYYAKWTIGTTIPVTAIFPNPPFTVTGSAVLVYDTTKIPGIGVTSKFTPVFVKYDTANAQYEYLTNIGLFYRTFQVKSGANIRNDSLRFIILAKPRSGIGVKFECFNETFDGTVSGVASPVTLKITGEFVRTEVVTVGSTDYSAYYVEISRLITVGTTPVATGVTAKLWVVENVGPVKMHLIGDAENHGNYRVMTSKNFP